jgi:hypothetical protein
MVSFVILVSFLVAPLAFDLAPPALSEVDGQGHECSEGWQAA